MAGTVWGGKRAAEIIRERHGDDFYRKIGKLGGAKSKGGGFAKDREFAREMGRKGGLVTKARWAREDAERGWN